MTGVLTQVESRRPSARFLQSMMLIVCIVAAALAVLPPVWVILSALEPPTEFFGTPPIIPNDIQWSGLIQVWKSLDFGELYLNSFYYLAGALVTSLLFNALLGYVLSRLKPRGSRLVAVLVLWTLMIPNTVSVVATYHNIIDFPVLRANLSNSFYPLWIMAGGNAFYVLIFKSFFDRINNEYLEAARLDGASDLAVFRHIILPMSRPVFITVGILTATYVWSDFFWPYMTLTNGHNMTTMVGIYSAYSVALPYNEILIALAFGMLPPVVLFVLLQRYINQGFTLAGLRG